MNENGFNENLNMEYFEELVFLVLDIEVDFVILLVKCLNSVLLFFLFVCYCNDNFVIIRLNNELLKVKKSNWEVLDVLVKVY